MKGRQERNCLACMRADNFLSEAWMALGKWWLSKLAERLREDQVIKMWDDEWHLLSIGVGGWTGHCKTVKDNIGSHQSRTEGYCDDYDLQRAADGCVVVDVRPAEHRDDFVSNVLRGPLPNPDVEGEDVVVCPEASDWLRAGIEGNQFGSLLKHHDMVKGAGQKIGPLDYVSPFYYAQWWYGRGARIGVVKKGKILWKE